MYLFRSLLSRRVLLFILLLVVMGATTSLLAFGFVVFDREFSRRLTISEIGAIPEVQLEFKKNLTAGQLDSLAEDLLKELNPDYMYCGNKISGRFRFAWDKFMRGSSRAWQPTFAELTYHDFDVQLIAIQPPAHYYLEVDDGCQLKKIICVKMHPYDGFFIPEGEAVQVALGTQLELKRTYTGKLREREVSLEAYNPPKFVLLDDGKITMVNGRRCLRYGLEPCPPGQDYYKYFEDVEVPASNILVQLISHVSLSPLGELFWESLPEEILEDDGDIPVGVRSYAWRLFAPGKFHVLYSQELRESIMGKSLRNLDNMQIKPLMFEGHQDDGNLQPLAIENVGYFRARYRTGVNGKILIFSRDRLEEMLGDAGKVQGYNYIALGKKGETQEDLLKVINRCCLESGGDMYPPVFRSQLARARMFGFIITGGKMIKAIGLVMVMCCIVMYFLAAFRLQKNIDESWDKLVLLGATCRQRLGLDFFMVAVEIIMGIVLISTVFCYADNFFMEIGGRNPDLYVNLQRTDLYLLLAVYGGFIIAGRLLPGIFQIFGFVKVRNQGT